MEPLRKELAEGVFLTYVPAAKFKTGVLGAQLITPLEESTVAAGALLPAVLAAAAVVFLLSARGLPARDAVTADFGGIFRFDGQLTLTAAVLGGFLLLAAAALRLVSGGMAGLELILSVFLACSGAALLYALIAQRRSGAFAPTALLVPVCFLVVQLIVTYRANARDSVLGHFYVELLLLAALFRLLLAAGDAGFDGVIVAGDLFGGSQLLFRFLLFLLDLLRFPPDHELRAHDLNALRARRFAKCVADLARGHHRRFQHAALHQLVNVQQLFRFGDQRFRYAAFADHQRRVNRIGLRPKRSAFLTCHVRYLIPSNAPVFSLDGQRRPSLRSVIFPASADIFCKTPARRAPCGKLRFSVRSEARHTSCQAREDKRPGRSQSRFPRVPRA